MIMPSGKAPVEMRRGQVPCRSREEAQDSPQDCLAALGFIEKKLVFLTHTISNVPLTTPAIAPRP